MRLSGILIVTAALTAALFAGGSAGTAAELAYTGGIYPWYRYGYNFPPPYGAIPPTAEYLVTGRSVAAGPGYGYRLYCAYGYNYPFGCPYLGW